MSVIYHERQPVHAHWHATMATGFFCEPGGPECPAGTRPGILTRGTTPRGWAWLSSYAGRGKRDQETGEAIISPILKKAQARSSTHPAALDAYPPLPP